MLTFLRPEYCGRVVHGAHSLVGDYLVGGREYEGPPAFHKRVGFCAYFLHLSFQLPLGRQQTIPQVIPDETLLQQVLECGFVLAETNGPVDIRNGTPQECSLQRNFRCWGVLLQKGDVGIAFRM